MTIKEFSNISEGRRLEFKGELPGKSDLAKTACANCYLVFIPTFIPTSDIYSDTDKVYSDIYSDTDKVYSDIYSDIEGFIPTSKVQRRRAIGW